MLFFSLVIQCLVVSQISHSECQLPLKKLADKKDIDECVLTSEDSFKKGYSLSPL